MAETFGGVDLQHHFVVDAGVSLIFDLTTHKKQFHRRRTSAEFNDGQGMPILCKSANRGGSCRNDC